MKIKALQTVRIAYEGKPAKKQIQLIVGRIYENLDDEIVKTALDIGAAEKSSITEYVKKVVSPSEQKSEGRKAGRPPKES